MLLKSKSLLSSLIIRISLVSIVSIVVLSGIVYTQIDHTLKALREQTVEEQSKNISRHVEPNKGINKVFLDLPNSLRQFYAKESDTYQYLVRDEEGNRLFASPGAFADHFPRNFMDQKDEKFEFAGPNGRQFIGITIQKETGGKNLYIQVAQAKNAADTFSDDITRAFLSRLLWVGIPFYCGLLIVIAWTVRGGLQPLHNAAQEVGKMSLTDLGLRIKEDGVPAEVLPLVRSVNSSFARLEQSIREQREFTEDIAHDLRTPLTILKTRIDTLDRTEQTVKLSRDIDATIQQMNQMLDVTRLEYADALKKSDVDLAEVLSQACQDFFPLFIKEQRELRVSGIDRPVMIRGNKDLIHRAICNLIDNALEYSPPKTSIDAVLDNKTIKITDYGKKIPEEKRKIIFKRFHKDSSPSAHRSGAGLGLSIVAKTMEIHGGSADLEMSENGGNTFRMIF